MQEPARLLRFPEPKRRVPPLTDDEILLLRALLATTAKLATACPIFRGAEAGEYDDGEWVEVDDG